MKKITIFFLLSVFSVTGYSVTFSGTVINGDKQPVAGALVTIFAEERLISETVYSNLSGNFLLNTALTGDIKVRIRMPGYSDYVRKIQLNKKDVVLGFVIEKIIDKDILSQNLTASAHAAQIKFTKAENQQAFRSQCHFCHQLGNNFTRHKRSREEWDVIIKRMEGYGVLINSENKETIMQGLMTNFNGKPLDTVQSWDYSPTLSQAKYKEWRVGDGNSYIHDIEVGGDGKLYGVDMGNDKIYIIDPVTDQVKIVDFPPSDLPEGGMFSGAYSPLGTFNSRHGPHSIQLGPDGKLWTTNSLAAELMSFDPKTDQFKIYPIGGDAVYPHTLRFDNKGVIWFTLALSNQIGRFDPTTENFTILDTPSNGFWRWMSDAMLPSVLKIASWFPKKNLHVTLSHHKVSGDGHKVLNLPYGIDVHPLNGSIWYGKLYAGIIGRIDPETMQIEEFKTPLAGPRRLRFSKNGTLWIPSFDESAIMKFDTKSKTFEVIEMPTLSLGEYETPYALNIHPDTGDVWISSNLSDRLFRYIPAKKEFITYPSPTRVTFLRDIIFHPDGGVCSSNANLPAYSIEGGLQNMLCIYPYANKKTLHDSDVLIEEKNND